MGNIIRIILFVVFNTKIKNKNLASSIRAIRNIKLSTQPYKLKYFTCKVINSKYFKQKISNGMYKYICSVAESVNYFVQIS